MKLGTMVHLDENVVEKIKDVKKYGLESFQLCAWNHSLMTDEYVEKILEATKETGDNGVAMILDHFRRVLK
jgi:hypothetical protein